MNEQNSGWIDVTERMPAEEKKYGLRVLAYFMNYNDGKRKYYSTDLLYYKNGVFYYGNCGGPYIKQVTHWMPLPKKPKIKKP